MPTKSDHPISVTEVLELIPDQEPPTWVPEFVGVIAKMNAFTANGKNIWACTVRDTTGSAEVGVTFFQAPRFAQGDTVLFGGSGMRRSEYKGEPTVKVSQKSVQNVTIRGNGAPVPPAGRPAAGAGSQPPQHHDSNPPGRPGGSTPAAGAPYRPDAFPTAIHGASVGLAIKEGLALAIMEAGGVAAMQELQPNETPMLDKKEFWLRVRLLSSNICRLAIGLEAGNLTKIPWEPDQEEKNEAEAQRQIAEGFAEKERQRTDRAKPKPPAAPPPDEDVPW